MTFLLGLCRLGARVLPAAAPVLVASALLTACGGGTSQVEAFHPARLIVFGDENSMIKDDGNTGDGFKYTINDRTATNEGKCLALPTFVQSLASHYGFVFKQCNPSGDLPKAFVQALEFARVDDATTGLAQQIASVPDLNVTDMVSVMIGANDVIELYERTQNGGMSSADAMAEAARRGTHAAEQVSAILKTGARAIVVLTPDMGLSPYAMSANLIDPGASALMSSLTYQFNGNLRTQITPNDGRYFGLVLGDDSVAAMAKSPSSFLSAPSDATNAACTTALVTDCVITNDTATTTLVNGAASGTHLWASDRNFGPNAHSRIAAQVVARAANNPF